MVAPLHPVAGIAIGDRRCEKGESAEHQNHVEHGVPLFESVPSIWTAMIGRLMHINEAWRILCRLEDAEYLPLAA
jgi:hypothetical protein